MNVAAMEPHGQSLQDFYDGEIEAKVLIHRDDGHTDEMLASDFFRQPEDFSPLEQVAIDLCRGDVLDIGAGAGCHSLVLQARGLSVLAIDVSPQAVAVMIKRGVKNVQCRDIFEVQTAQFDTLLLMMHGIGLVETLSGLDRFLDHAHQLIKPGGQLLLDSLDVRYTENPVHLAYQAANRQVGYSVGEIRMQFEYKGQVAPLFGWLHVDPETLFAHALSMGWSCKIVYRADSGDYLAQLTPMVR